jgi:hypothetical protein
MFAAQSGPGSDPFAAPLMKPLPVAQIKNNNGGRVGGNLKQPLLQQQQSQVSLGAGGGGVYFPQQRITVAPNDDEDDNQSSYTQQQQQNQRYETRSQVLTVASAIDYANRYPPLEPEERERRLQEYHNIRYPLKTPEEVSLEMTQRILDNNLAVENQVQMVEFSEHFMKVKRSAVVPQHCTNLHHNGLYGEVRFSLRDGKEIDYKPSDSPTCYGSIFDWAQGGIDIRPAPEPYGELHNVYLIRYYFNNFRNTSPVAVGVVMGETKKGIFTPLGKCSEYCDSNYSSGGVRNTFHYIIPPYGESSTETDLYRSSPHVNNSYGKEYPFLTSSRASILEKCVPVGDAGSRGHLVPLRHPIANWCFDESNLPENEMPKIAQDDQEHGGVHFRVPKKTVEIAVHELQKKASLYIPVTDMRALTLRFVPLVNGPFSADQVLRSELEREYEVEGKWGGYNGEGATKLDAAKRSNKKQLKDMYGISFKSGFFIMYRKWAADAVDYSYSAEGEIEGGGGEDD